MEEYQGAQELKRVPISRYEERRAARPALDDRIKALAGRKIRERGLSPEGKDLDKQRRGRTNFVVLKAAIDNIANTRVGLKAGERHEFTLEQINLIDKELDDIVAEACSEVFDG